MAKMRYFLCSQVSDMTDPISEGHSCSPEVDERACRRERNSSGGTYEKLEELQFAMEEKEHQFAKFLEAKMEQLEMLKTRNAELQKQVAVKMVELKEVESQILEKEGDLQVDGTNAIFHEFV